MAKNEMEIWNRIRKMEPMLNTLYKEAAAVRDDKTRNAFCANEYWMRSGLKFQVGCYVGPEAVTKNPELKSPEAFNTAYSFIYKALPPCRNCGCC